MSGDLDPMDGADEVGQPDGETRGRAGASRTARPSPRPYRAPRLVAYGCLTDVTRFGGSQIVDSGGGLGQPPG